MPRRASSLVILLLALLAATPAAARPSDADEARALLATVAGTGGTDTRLAAVTSLIELDGHANQALEEFLRRPRTATVEQRRDVLKLIKASIPDKTGKFESPGRQKAAAVRADDEFDWLAALSELPAATVGAGEVTADIAALRALSASKQIDAARVILAVGFAPDTMIYRDECGRQLRKMAPYSVPALIVGAQAKKDAIQRRYSNYQLERMDRQDPGKALTAAAGDEDLLIAVLEAFGSTEHREAVGSVFTMINVEAPRVRKAARDAWIAYVTGPPPPDPPEKFLVMAGGKKATKKTPLWLNSRQLARIELTGATEELTGEILDDKADLEQATLKIFAHHDAERAGRDAAIYNEGKAKADAGDLAGAIVVYDRLLAQDPGRPDRIEMAAIYFTHAEALVEAKQWADAAAMYSKAHGLAPESERATDALAAHYYALGKSQEADGKDGSAAYRRAVELRPDYAEAKRAARAASGAADSGPSWMLYAAGCVAAGALLLLVLGLRRRK